MKGGPGRNIPLDLMVEHNNNLCKEMISNQGANVTFESSRTMSRAVKTVNDVMTNFDKEAEISGVSGQHCRASSEDDVLKISHCLIQGKCCDDMGVTRGHKSFPKIKKSHLSSIDKDKLFDWIKKRKSEFRVRNERGGVASVNGCDA